MAQGSSAGDAAPREMAGVPYHDEHRAPGMTQRLKLSLSTIKDRVIGGHLGAEAGPHSPDSERESLVGEDSRSSARLAHGSPRSASVRSERIDSSSPEVTHRDLGERIMEHLPGSHTSPYSTGHVTQPTAAAVAAAGNPYVSGNEAAAPSRPTAPGTSQERHSHTTRLMNRVWGMVGGRKPAQEGPTNSNAETEGLVGEKEGYVQGPKSRGSGDIYGRAKQKLKKVGQKDNTKSEVQETVWPAPAKPDDFRDQPGATFTDEEGRPIEGPTQPKEEDTKKEGLMTKVMDKVHVHEDSAAPPESTTPTTEAHVPPVQSSSAI